MEDPILDFIAINPEVDCKAMGKEVTAEGLDLIGIYYTDCCKKLGFSPPWLGYLIFKGNQLVGGCGFKGKPVDNKVEIGYGIFSPYEGQGLASKACKWIVTLALNTKPDVIISARTLPDNDASIQVLKKNRFVYNGLIIDEDEGEVCERLYR